MRPASVNSQIRNLLLLIGSAVLSAFVLGGFLIYHYGPTGQYQVNQALISPNLLANLNYNDTNIHTNSLARYLFDGLELTLVNPKTQQKKQIPIDINSYKKIYALIANDESLKPIPEEVMQAFSHKELIATLAIKVRTESHANWIDERKDFQLIDFAKHYYRIHLHEEKTPDMWAYFQHQNIFDKLMAELSNGQ